LYPSNQMYSNLLGIVRVPPCPSVPVVYPKKPLQVVRHARHRTQVIPMVLMESKTRATRKTR
jgi:hypothetical protein